MTYVQAPLGENRRKAVTLATSLDSAMVGRAVRDAFV